MLSLIPYGHPEREAEMFWRIIIGYISLEGRTERYAFTAEGENEQEVRRVAAALMQIQVGMANQEILAILGRFPTRRLARRAYWQ